MPVADNGIPYLPDGVIGAVPAAPAPPRRPAWLIVVLFMATFALLQWGWQQSRDTWLERAVIHQATVRPAAQLIRGVDPGLPAAARGARIEAPGGGLNIKLGCEGVEIMFLLIAALVAMPIRWLPRVAGLAAGLALIYALNQARIVALFFAWRADRSLFEALHTLVLPAFLVFVVTAFVYLLVNHDVQPTPA